MPDDFSTRLDQAMQAGKGMILTDGEVLAVFLALARLRDLEKFGYARDWKSIKAYCPLTPEGTPVREEPPPFGAVRFDGTREFDGATNQDRAEDGKKVTALAYLLSAREEGWEEVTEYADTINLDVSPELPLTDLLLAVQHYAHRDRIPLYGKDGAWALAQQKFNEQSGGAAL